MKENDLTYELICAAVNGEKTALEEILRFYDDYINACLLYTSDAADEL